MVRLEARQISVKGPHGTVLPPTSLTVASGQLTVIHGEPGVGVTALGLILAGRIESDQGSLMLKGVQGQSLRTISAVIDAPSVSEPDDALPVSVVIGEELALAKKSASKEDVARWLNDHDAADFAKSRFEDLTPQLRTRLLTAAAASRPGVKILILVTPDRHTSDYESWFALAREYADQGFAVVVLIATTPVSALAISVAKIGELEQPDSLVCQEIAYDTHAPNSAESTDDAEDAETTDEQNSDATDGSDDTDGSWETDSLETTSETESFQSPPSSPTTPQASSSHEESAEEK